MPSVLIVVLSAFKACSRLLILTAANNYYKKTGLKKIGINQPSKGMLNCILIVLQIVGNCLELNV